MKTGAELKGEVEPVKEVRVAEKKVVVVRFLRIGFDRVGRSIG